MDWIPGPGGSPGDRKGNPLQYFCPGKSNGQKSLVGCSPRGHKESDTLWDLTITPPSHSCPYGRLCSEDDTGKAHPTAPVHAGCCNKQHALSRLQTSSDGYAGWEAQDGGTCRSGAWEQTSSPAPSPAEGDRALCVTHLPGLAGVPADRLPQLLDA